MSASSKVLLALSVGACAFLNAAFALAQGGAPVPTQPSTTGDRGPAVGTPAAPTSTTTRGPTYGAGSPQSPYGYGVPYQPSQGHQQPATPVHYIPFYPDTLPYRDGQTIPPGYVVQTTANSGLRTGGIVTLLLAYGLALGGGAASGFDRGSKWLAAPLVGPWGAIAARDFPCETAETALDDRKCINQALDDAAVVSVFVFNGIVQAAGLTMTIVGAATKSSQLVRKDRIVLRPSLDPRMAGLRVDGSF